MLIDWMSFTIRESPQVWLENLQAKLPGPWEGRERGLHGYTQTLRCGGVFIYTGAPGSDALYVNVSGEGCRELVSACVVTNWPQYLGQLLRDGAKFSRLDVALDDRSRLLDMAEMERCCREGLVVSRYDQARPGEARGKNGQLAGRSIYFGQRGSGTLFRIYDKALQEGVAGHWVRVEIETRKERSRSLAKSIAKHGAGCVPSVVLGCLSFKERGTSERRNRWKIAEWWTRFLGTDKAFRLEAAPRDGCLEKKRRYLFRNVSASFALVYDAGEGDEFVKAMLSQGRQRLERQRTGPK